MTGNTHHRDDARTGPDDDARLAADGGILRSLSDPETLRGRTDVPFEAETVVREDRDHCGVRVDGRAVAGVRNDAGELLVLVNPDLGIALLPHGDVEPGEDWVATARREVEALTGVTIELEAIDVVRTVDHVLEGEDDPHATTTRVLFQASPVGGEIQACKRSAAAGSDRWEAAWLDELPADVTPADGGPGDDLRWFLD
ncbi:NUDIX hydrolase [Halopiger goleimassiliensis]|uniref:NUDIX hydrolase n=1 Tax=Halopiger goleimassiliensis TaxID=1293048 RepID=UPI000677F117|nr:NUDIX domain-containing protein [Halopiger goleimassiliensis]